MSYLTPGLVAVNYAYSVLPNPAPLVAFTYSNHSKTPKIATSGANCDTFYCQDCMILLLLPEFVTFKD